MPFTEPIILVKVKVTLLGLLVGTSTSRNGLNLTLKQPVVCLRASWQWNRGEALSALWHRLKRYRKQTKEKKVLIAIKTHCRESRAQQLAQSQEFFCCCVLFFFKWRRHLTWRGGGWVVAFPHLPPHAATMQCTKKVLVFLCTLRRRCHQLSASSMINPLSPHRRGGRGGRVRGGGKWRKKKQIRRRNTTPTRSTASKHSIRASLGGIDGDLRNPAQRLERWLIRLRAVMKHFQGSPPGDRLQGFWRNDSHPATSTTPLQTQMDPAARKMQQYNSTD